MSKEMIIATSPHETKVALLEEGQVVEVHLEREKEVGLVGSIYKGRVTRVLPGMQSAFVDIGLERDAFLYVSDFFEDLEEYERVPAAPEREGVPAEAPPPAAFPEPAPDVEPQPAEDRQPVEERQPAEDRQPDFVSAEPPLLLPERRPLGRPPRRPPGRPRHRGGRGRHRRDRGPFPPREPSMRREAPPGVPHEPIILPGESLAKYRGRAAPAPPEHPPEEPPPAPTKNSSTHNPGEPTSNGPLNPKNDLRRSENRGEPDRSPASDEPLRAESAPGADDSHPAPEAQPESSSPAREEEARPAEPANEHYPEASTLAELERVRLYQDQVGLPPSVRERTAGGVEWDRSRGARGRGGPRRRHRRPHAPGRRPPMPSRPSRPSRGQPPIAQLLRAGQEIIVQIAKEQMGKKGARITSHITLPGRFLVYMPTIDHIGISRKIGTAEERARLRRLLLELKGTITGGFVVRTAATGCSEEDLRQDIDYLVKLWHDLRVRAEDHPAPTLLHSDLSLVERMLRDHLVADYESAWIDSEEEYAKVLEFVSQFQPALTNRVKLFTKPTPIFEEMGVQQEIDRALRPKVWLKSGGYIVINHTEALVAIDVNTGKFVGKGSTRLEDTIVKTNVEAVQEIVRQIRLRDLGGIIIIDFIDMEDGRNRQRVMRALEDALRADRSPSKILAFNEFGLVAITRKRSRQPLERLLCQPCPYCTGTGMVKSLPTLCYEIQAEAKKMAGAIDAPELTIRAHPEIVKALKGQDNHLVRELEEQTGKNIILQSDTTLHLEQYNIY